MRRTKRRDPAKEPHASSITDDERRQMIQRIQKGAHDDSDLTTYLYDQQRAVIKLSAAATQLSKPDDERSALFSRPDVSAASATGTCETYFAPNWLLQEAGASAKRVHRKAGLGRHSEFNDPHTAERYRVRRDAWRKINQESDARGGQRVEGRQLAAQIARMTGHPYNTVRTWIREEVKRLQSADKQRPSISPGDWSGLMLD